MVDFVLEQNPGSRRATRQEALDIIDAEAKRGHFQTAWFGPYNRFYAICNCCGCCCAAVEAMQKYGIPMIASSGYVASVDPKSCKACGDCMKACFFNAISVEETAVVSRDACMGCGVCARTCPNGAMSLIADIEKGIPLDVTALGGEAR
jgi:ferredoxin